MPPSKRPASESISDGGAVSDVSSVNSSDVSSVHTSELSGLSDGGSGREKKQKQKVKRRKVSATRPLEPEDSSWQAVKASQKHMYTAEPPTREEDGTLVFEDTPEFRPNLTPSEIIQRGSFGGGYYRNIKSSATGRVYKEAHKEFPKEWWAKVNPGSALARSDYSKGANRYNVKCGQTLEQWEDQGWMEAVDPFGWFQWYCRFYLGRRSYDDKRQIGRGLRCFGPTGRWRTRLMNMINKAGTKHSDVSVSPVIRQTLQHWGYRVTKAHYREHCDNKGLTY